MIKLRRGELERIERHFTPEPNTGCWLWYGARLPRGYGQMYFRGHRLYAHRLMFALFRRSPGALLVLHRCDTPECVNPDHLFLGTQADNMQDAKRKGRMRMWLTPERTRGELNVKAKITDAQRAELLVEKRRGSRTVDLARRYGITTTRVCQIVRAAQQEVF